MAVYRRLWGRVGVVVWCLLTITLLVPLVPRTSTHAQPADVQPFSPPLRWIIQLEQPPLAQAPSLISGYAVMSDGQGQQHTLSLPNLTTPAAIHYRALLVQQQQALFHTLQQAYPQATLHRSFQLLFNGISVVIPGSSAAVAEHLRSLDGVVLVAQEQVFPLSMYASIPIINAETLWNTPAIGGHEHAGEGVKIAVIDSGIAIDHPLFRSDGFVYPPGFPKGDAAYTTPKVIAARNYIRPDVPPSEGSDTPVPGRKDSSHGTHVSGTAAGGYNTTATAYGITQNISGVAPRAYLMNYKAFYDNHSIFSGMAFETELMAAIEDAVADGADIISNSWGGRDSINPLFSPLAMASNVAADVGVTVIFSVGNDGPSESTADSGDTGNKLIMVGATSTARTIAAGFVDVVAPDGMPSTMQLQPYSAAEFGTRIRQQVFGPAEYVPLVSVGQPSTGCDPLPDGLLTGKIALIERGICHFSTKTYYAEQAGANAVIVYNHADGGDEIITMGPGDFADDVTIPTVFVGNTMGTAMIDWYNQHGAAVRVQIDPSARIIDSVPDVLASFSSRGPTFQQTLRPDLVAPGVNILSGGYGTEEGQNQHMGFGVASGTSMATPHVSGGAALLKQLHPEWSPLDIKSALMSTATTEVWEDDKRTAYASVLGKGAGRIDLARAANPGVLLNYPSLSFGSLAAHHGQPTRAEVVVEARNITQTPQTYQLSAYATDGSAFAITVAPSTLTVAPGSSAPLYVTVELPPDTAPGDYEGIVLLAGDGVPNPLHMPVWLRQMPVNEGADVLLIDNDGSSSMKTHNYADYYINALNALAVNYTYRDVDALAGQTQTVPDISELQRYEVIIWFTGDYDTPNGSFKVPTPLTDIDQNLLIAYLQSGGTLLATGQNLADASDIESYPDDKGYGRSDLYRYFLGSRFVQNNVFEGMTQLPLIVGTNNAAWLRDITLNVSSPEENNIAPSDQSGAGNQHSVDEITVLEMDPRTPDEYTFPILQTDSTGKREQGFVGMSRHSEPTLEQPASAFAYRTLYLPFGVEGVRSDTGTTTMKELLQKTLYWFVDKPWATLHLAPESNTVVAQQDIVFTAECSSNIAAQCVRYRWDAGDGSPIITSEQVTTTHQYQQAGNYTVRVEATDYWGHSAIATVPIAVGVNTSVASQTTPAASQATSAPATAPAPEEHFFAETGYGVAGRFWEYWQQHGGLSVFGYPISAQQHDTPVSQVFERVRFEHHPEHAAPYDVLLGRLGIDALAAQGRDWHTFPTVAETPNNDNCFYFAETQHSVCGVFLHYWQTHGLAFDGQPGTSMAESLALFGLPVSEQHIETIEGHDLIVQWFERARFEYHDDTQTDTPILLGRLGAEVYGTALSQPSPQ